MAVTYKEIPLRGGDGTAKALVSIEDYDDAVAAGPWYINVIRNKKRQKTRSEAGEIIITRLEERERPYIYATRQVTKTRPDGTSYHSWERLHRYILARKYPDVDITKYFADHINHDGLDNRRSNIRLSTPRQNSLNAQIHEAAPNATAQYSSRYKGVSVWHYIGKKGQSTFVKVCLFFYGKGFFFGDKNMTEDMAARIYDYFQREFNSDNCAYLNCFRFHDIGFLDMGSLPESIRNKVVKKLEQVRLHIQSMTGG